MARKAGNEQAKLNTLLEKFEAFLRDVSLKPWWSKSRKHNVYMMRTYGHNNAQLQWDGKAIHEATQALQETLPLISDKTAKRLVRELMVSLFEDQFIREDAEPNQDADIDSLYDVLDRSNLRQTLDEFVQKIQDRVKPYRVLLPLLGIELKSRTKVRIGLIDLHYPADPVVTEILEKLTKRLGENSNHVSESLKDIKCFAVVDIMGEEDFVHREARRLATESIDILNLYLSSSLHQPKWETIRVGDITINLSLELEEVLPGFQQHFPSSLPFHLDTEGLEHLEKWGLLTLNERINNQSSNEITKRLKRAITWYGKAVNADSHEESFVNLAIALESLLINKSEENNYTTAGSITQKLRERVAFLLGKSKAHRIQLSRRTAELYGFRSGIVHSGQLVGPSELEEMDLLVGHTILAILQRDISKWDDLLQFIENQRYSSPDDKKLDEEE